MRLLLRMVRMVGVLLLLLPLLLLLGRVEAVAGRVGVQVAGAAAGCHGGRRGADQLLRRDRALQGHAAGNSGRSTTAGSAP